MKTLKLTDEARKLADDHAHLVPLWIRIHFPQTVAHQADFDDATQEGLTKLLEVAKKFDPTRGASFRTFAEHCVKNHLLKVVTRGYMTRGKQESHQCPTMDRLTEKAAKEHMQHLTPAQLKLYKALFDLSELPVPSHGAVTDAGQAIGLTAGTAQRTWSRIVKRLEEKYT